MSRSYIPARPEGDSAEARYHQAVWDYLFGGKLPLLDTSSVRWQRGAAYAAHANTGSNRAVPLHPFQIVRWPEDPASASDWRKFRVHHGLCFLDWVEVTVTNTDLDATTSTEATDASAKFWFWLEVTSGAVAVQSSATAPTWDSSHVPIGYVNTQTSGAAVITQIINTNLFLCT